MTHTRSALRFGLRVLNEGAKPGNNPQALSADSLHTCPDHTEAGRHPPHRRDRACRDNQRHAANSESEPSVPQLIPAVGVDRYPRPPLRSTVAPLFERCLLWNDPTKGDTTNRTGYHVANRKPPNASPPTRSDASGRKRRSETGRCLPAGAWREKRIDSNLRRPGGWRSEPAFPSCPFELADGGTSDLRLDRYRCRTWADLSRRKPSCEAGRTATRIATAACRHRHPGCGARTITGSRDWGTRLAENGRSAN